MTNATDTYSWSMNITHLNAVTPMLTSIIHMVDETRLHETGVDEMSIRRNRIRRTGTNPDVHTKTAVLNRLGSLLVLTRDVNSKVLQAEEWSSRSRTTVVNISANASDRLANTAVEKAIVRKKPVNTLYSW